MILSQNILEVENLYKHYRKATAVGGVSFTVARGEVVGLLGPNGAGKTTTIDMILGVVEPSSGAIRVFGMDFQKHRADILQRMNFSAVYAHLPGNLTVWQNLYIFARLYGLGEARERVAALMEEFDLVRFSRVRAGFLSSGEQSRLHLAKALLNKPQMLLMDEPTASVDPSISQIIRTRIRQYARDSGAAVLWTSHDMREVEEVCDRVLFISHGKILLEGNPQALARQHGKKDLEDLFIAVAREPLSLRG